MRMAIAGMKDGTACVQAMQKAPPSDPMVIVDLRRYRDQKRVEYMGEELPVYHSFDVLQGLSSWEESLYETNIENVMAVYPPSRDSERPDLARLPEFPWESVLLFVDPDMTPMIEETSFDKKYCVSDETISGYHPVPLDQIASLVLGRGEPGFFGRLFQRLKGK